MFLSIIVPFYNIGQDIARLLGTLLPQMNDDVEVVFVDDGSVDLSQEILQEQISKINSSAKFKIIRQENMGVSSARNNGIKNAEGEYIAFIDADDYIDTRYIEKVRDLDDADCVLFGFDRVNYSGCISKRFEERYRYPTTGDVEEILNMIFLKEFELCVGTMLFKRKIILDNNLEFPVGHKYCEDIAFRYKYFCHVSKIKIICESLYYYVAHPTSSMRTIKTTGYSDVRLLLNTLSYMEKRRFTLNSLRYFERYLLLGAIVSEYIRRLKQIDIIELHEVIPRDLIKYLSEASILDTVSRKGFRGLVLYVVCKLLWFASCKPVFAIRKLAILVCYPRTK